MLHQPLLEDILWIQTTLLDLILPIVEGLVYLAIKDDISNPVDYMVRGYLGCL